MQVVMYKHSKLWEICIRTTIHIQKHMIEVCNFTLNQNQCYYLAQKLEEIIKNIQGIFSHIGELPNSFDLLLKELLQIIEKAKLLVEQCCSQKWYHAALLQINNEEAFEDLFRDLEHCYDDICQHAKDQWGEQMEVSFEYHRVNFLPSTKRLKLVNDDKHALMRKLEATIGTSQPLHENNNFEEEFKIAVHLLKRFEKPFSIDVSHFEGWGCMDSLGQGQYGIVQKTSWFGFPCAKKMQMWVESKDGADKIFENEVAILASTNHPNIVKFIGCGLNPKECTSFISMELMETNLDNLIQELSKNGKKMPFAIHVAMDIILQIAKGMSYLHKNNIAHRDLKPTNVLVNRFAVDDLGNDNHVIVKLADFGLSKMNVNGDTSNHLSRGVGTKSYKAPELFQKVQMDKKKVDKRKVDKVNAHQADVYSFGIMCSKILSGHDPFTSPENFLARLRSGERPRLPNNCPERLVSLIQDCWLLDRTKRPNFEEICKILRGLKSFALKTKNVNSCHEAKKNKSIFDWIIKLLQYVPYIRNYFWRISNLEAIDRVDNNQTQQTRQTLPKVTTQILSSSSIESVP
jgi:serine/threonine protein kinase